jgi:predicted RNase H-like HicB family nuclease
MRIVEKRITIHHIERLPEGVYLAASDDIQGLVAQGRTITETLEIARDVTKMLIELPLPMLELPEFAPQFDYPLVAGV